MIEINNNKLFRRLDGARFDLEAHNDWLNYFRKRTEAEPHVISLGLVSLFMYMYIKGFSITLLAAVNWYYMFK